MERTSGARDAKPTYTLRSIPKSIRQRSEQQRLVATESRPIRVPAAARTYFFEPERIFV
jgi:hypothetical protein